jgi:hypothetical protein
MCHCGYSGSKRVSVTLMSRMGKKKDRRGEYPLFLASIYTNTNQQQSRQYQQKHGKDLENEYDPLSTRKFYLSSGYSCNKE